MGDLIGIVLNLWIALRIMAISTVIVLLTQEHRICFCFLESSSVLSLVLWCLLGLFLVFFFFNETLNFFYCCFLLCDISFVSIKKCNTFPCINNISCLPCSEKALVTHSSTLAWKIPRMEEPGGLQSMGSLSQTWLSNFTFTFHFHALEKEMATHSSVLAWRIPGTAEPGRLLSVGSHRVGHNWCDLAAAATCKRGHHCYGFCLWL